MSPSLRPLQASPYTESLGIRQYDLGEGRARSAVDLDKLPDSRPENAYRGLLATMLDVTMAAAISLSGPDREMLSTLNLDVHYLQRGGDALTAEAVALHVGEAIAVAYGEVQDSGGTIVAVATGSFRIGLSDTASQQ